MAALADANFAVYRALQFIGMMLAGDNEINWTAANAAIEVIEGDLTERGLKGQALGWWSRSEMTRFTATANSSEALGIHARHGKSFNWKGKPMSRVDASWLVRRAAARWITYLLEQEQP